jgi:glycosyltransferase involved in cell wall biosynthesis
MMDNLRIASFGGFRSIPPQEGGAGADKFAVELYPRLVKRGYKILAYCRIYSNTKNDISSSYKGVSLKWFKTVKKSGFDTLLHSFKSTLDIIINDTANLIHIQSGANSIWALFLRIAGKKVYVSQFAMDWKRDKWPWYGKLFYRISNYLTAYCPNGIIFDNIYTKKYFEEKFNRQYNFIPYGCEVSVPGRNNKILSILGVEAGKYFLFVGRFIPDKGVHFLINAFEKLDTDYKLVLVGGSPNPCEYENKLHRTKDTRIVFAGYIYGEDTNYLMKHAYTYIQPSLIEGLSPVILTIMWLGTPLICSDIIENKYIAGENALYFKSGSSVSLNDRMKHALSHYSEIRTKALQGKTDIKKRFNWEKVTDQFINVFTGNRTI